MKKKILKFMVIAIACCITLKAKAAYNGGGGYSYSGAIGSQSECVYQCFNGDYFFIQARLYYVDASNHIKDSSKEISWSNPIDSKGTCGGTFFFASGKSRDYLINDMKVNEACVWDNMEGQTADGATWNDSLIDDSDRYAKASKILRAYFGDDDNKGENKVYTPNDNLKKYLNYVTTSAGKTDTSESYASVMTKESIIANRDAKNIKDGAAKGYRLIIEPVLVYIRPQNLLLTPKQAANYSYNGVTGVNFNSSGSRPLTGLDKKGKKTAQAQYLYTDFADVGIDYGSYDWCANLSGDASGVAKLGDWNNGCGMNIIDVGKFVKTKKCYKKNTKIVSGNISCNNVYDKNVNASFTETYDEKKTCDKTDSKNDYTKYGKKIAKTDNCKLYCKEQADISLPGGISSPIVYNESFANTGIYFAWPVRYQQKTGMKMYMTSRLKCTVVQTEGKKCTETDIKKLIESGTSNITDTNGKTYSFSAKLVAGTNKKINGNLEIDKSYNKTGYKIDVKKPKKLNINSKGILGNITLSKTVYFKIPSKKNRYFNKTNGAVTDSVIGATDLNGKKARNDAIFDRKEGVVSLQESDFNLENKTEIKDLEITNIELGSSNIFGSTIKNTYKCSYLLQPSCKCPAGTVAEGTDLYEHLTEGKSCLELQETYCNECKCPPNTYYDGTDLTKYASGQKMTSKVCTTLQNDHCYSNFCFKPDGTKVDISDCMNNYVKEGKTIGQASALCLAEKCPDTSKKCPQADQTEWDKCMEIEKKNNEVNSYATCYKNLCENNICEKIKDDKDGQTKWDECIDGNEEKNYSSCYKKYCEEDDESPCPQLKDKKEEQKKWKACVGDAKETDKKYKDCYATYCKPACDKVPPTIWETCLVTEGKSYDTCYQEYCPHRNCKECKYSCKKKNGDQEEIIDITDCIDEKQWKYGMKFAEAKAACSFEKCENNPNKSCKGPCTWRKEKNKYVQYCEVDKKGNGGKVCLEYKIYCPDKKCLKPSNIVYRTVDLNNPFPGNNGGVTKAFSNTGTAGRYPHENWYYTESVRNKILNARGVSGDKLYTEKTPLYTIVLTHDDILKIRDYNKTHAYNDFELDCKNQNDTAACISLLLHNSNNSENDLRLHLYELIDRSNSIANCYNMNLDEAGFNACYNEDN